jgi:CBS domain-containing protein
MLVRMILAQKGTEVATIHPDATVTDAVAELGRRKIGALVVSADGRGIDGILSERDVMRGLAERGASVLDDPVSSLMTREVTTCVGDDSVDQLMALMTERRFRHLPVVGTGDLCGIVSIGDVVKGRVEELQVEAKTLHEYLNAGR